jgi:anthranilate synthase component 1
MIFEQFEKLAKPRSIVPLFRKLNADFITPVIAYLKMRESGTQSFLLESVTKAEQIGRYSFIGQQPFRVVTSADGETVINEFNSNRIIEENYFQVLGNYLDEYESVAIDGLPRFACGVVGFLGYDMVRCIEELPESKHDSIGTEDAVMGFYDNLVAFDHLKNEVIIIANVFVEEGSHLPQLYRDGQRRLDQLLERLNRPLPARLDFSADLGRFDSNFAKSEFEAAVDQAKDYIFAGDIFQVVLSQRFSVEFSGDPFQVYRSLRTINPSPYLYYLDFVDFQVIGSSPEPLIRAENNKLEIIPIAGTRPRGSSREDDEAQAENLLSDPKELAEHVMLVDLARNDMGRVSKYGSVKVSDFKTIERYSHVMHIISRVNGELKDGLTSIDAFQSAFPAGTVSGAPKIRAMEIIHDLEPEKRGIYSGAVGYFDYSGNMDMCITIRTIVAKGNRMFVQAGAGIVADSQPESEYEETLNKARALRNAIEKAAEGIDDFLYR